MSGKSGLVRFYNFPCPSCGSVVRPYANTRGRILCTNCGSELTQAIRGMLRISRMHEVREGTVGFASCGNCGTIVFALRQKGSEDDEYWTCVRCGQLVFV